MPNGLGPWWFPHVIRDLLTRFSCVFFDEAAWWRHDEGYAAGYPARCVCDREFLRAMLRDASHAPSTGRILACVGLALFFWSMVRIFGGLSYRR